MTGGTGSRRRLGVVEARAKQGSFRAAPSTGCGLAGNPRPLSVAEKVEKRGIGNSWGMGTSIRFGRNGQGWVLLLEFGQGKAAKNKRARTASYLVIRSRFLVLRIPEFQVARPPPSHLSNFLPHKSISVAGPKQKGRSTAVTSFHSQTKHQHQTDEQAPPHGIGIGIFHSLTAIHCLSLSSFY